MEKKAFYDAVAQLRARPLRERTAAVILLLREGLQGPELLFERRSAALRRQPGEVCLPGGGVEEGESPQQCVLRECAEELGLTELQLLGHVESLRHSTGERVEVFAGRVDSSAELKLQPSEVAEVFAVPLSWFREHEPKTARMVLVPDVERSSPELRELLPHYGRESISPLWLWEGRPIWGMTARIVRRFLDRLENAGEIW